MEGTRTDEKSNTKYPTVKTMSKITKVAGQNLARRNTYVTTNTNTHLRPWESV